MRTNLFLTGILFSTALSAASTDREQDYLVWVVSESSDLIVSEEAIGKTPGVVEVIDLTELASAGSVEVGLQAAGLDFWKIEPARAQ